jgi:hypothetical protein
MKKHAPFRMIRKGASLYFFVKLLNGYSPHHKSIFSSSDKDQTHPACHPR